MEIYLLYYLAVVNTITFIQEVHIRHSFDCHHTNIDNHIPIKYKLNRIFLN